ncbi:MAG: hypothetical protein WBG73_18080 [Coleofasciculaceae cyanobacterium]
MKRRITASLVLMIASLFVTRFAFVKINKLALNKSSCPQEIAVNLNEQETKITPYKLIIKPWEGRHNVQGVFMLPMEDYTAKIMVLSIPGLGTFCGGAYSVGTSFEGIQAKPGYHLVKTNLRTRTAIWLITRGFGNQLNDSNNWQLVNY